MMNDDDSFDAFKQGEQDALFDINEHHGRFPLPRKIDYLVNHLRAVADDVTDEYIAGYLSVVFTQKDKS